jgi:soluble lytic murein transglycosylase-like protein
MDNSIFTSAFQSALMNMYLTLQAKLNGSSGKNSSAQSATRGTGAGTYSASSTSSSPNQFAGMIEQAAQKYNVNTNLINAVIHAESGYNPNAVSSCGAVGLMQLMPGTAKSLGVDDSYNPVENIDGGVKFLSQLLNRYNGDVEKTVAAYNAGPGAVDKYGGVPPYRETQVYVQRVLGYMGNANDWSA